LYNKTAIISGSYQNRSIVAFESSLAAAIPSPQNTETIKFETVAINTEHDYHPHIGSFICEISGTYVFSWTMTVDTNKYINAHLKRNGEDEGYVYFSSYAYVGSGTEMAIIQLYEGDEVYVEIASSGSPRIFALYSSFDGFFLG